MPIKTILMSQLEINLRQTLNDCAASGDTLVVEMPDRKLFAIQLLDPGEDDALMDELLASHPKFQALVTRSKAGPRVPFVAGNS
ncbi:MAG: hypothetical protein WEB58_21215 [Planctomycetaceae bacterium]